MGLSFAVIAGCAPPPAGPMIPMTPSATPLHTPQTRSPEPFTGEVLARIRDVQPIVERAAQRHRLDPSLINGVIWVESRFDTRAKSSAGARGLMQLMPSTAAWLAESMGHRRGRAFDPEFNVAAGAYYLDRLINRYRGDLRWALVAYNAGPGNADKWRKRGTLPEGSQRYVSRVLEARARFSRWANSGGSGTMEQAPRSPGPPTPTRASARFAASDRLPGIED